MRHLSFSSRSFPRTPQRWFHLALLTLGMLVCPVYGLAVYSLPFYSIPRLIYTGTNRDYTHARSATYYFTLTFPPSEGAALGTLDLIQIEGISIPLVPDKTIAFLGTRRDRGAEIPVRVQTLAEGEQRGLRIQFEEAVSPNQTLTLAVRARSNPSQDDISLYALVAYPQGNLSDGYRIGTGRLHFYENTPFRL